MGYVFSTCGFGAWSHARDTAHKDSKARLQSVRKACELLMGDHPQDHSHLQQAQATDSAVKVQPTVAHPCALHPGAFVNL